LFVEGAFLGGQGFAAAQLVEHVVHAGQCQAGVRGLLAFAVGVELFGDMAGAVLDIRIRNWKRKCFEAPSFVVSRSVFQRPPGCKCPYGMNMTGKYAMKV